MNVKPVTLRVKAPGLRWIKRGTKFVPTWVAAEGDRKAGFRPKTLNLSRLGHDPRGLARWCDELQAEMLEWRSARDLDPLAFDGTVGSLMLIYRSHPQSSFQTLRPGSRHPYLHYIARIEREIGNRTVNSVSGLDLKLWHQQWSNGGKALAASAMCRAVLDAAVSFGVEARLRGCAELSMSLRATKRKLPRPPRRDSVISVEQVAALRQAAHADGRSSCALAYALVFETTLRLWDVIGQWVPDASAGRHAKKCIGIRWEDIDENLVLWYVPSKTSAKTGLAVAFPLSRAPMVMEELPHWPVEKRTGSVIVNERTGQPYSGNHFGGFWRKDRATVGLSETMWARDLRASGITEARAAAVATDDVAKVAGHASTKTTSRIYDRAALEAAERFADARAKHRSGR